MSSIRSLREKRQGLIGKVEAAFEKNGKKYVSIEKAGAVKDVPLEFVQRWLKEVEIELGLSLGRAMEDWHYED